MINVQMTVREIAWLISQCGDYQCDLFGRAVEALVGACENSGTKVTVSNIPTDHFISAIRIIRKYLVWTLKDTKDWCDVVRGRFESSGHWEGDKYVAGGYFTDGRPNTLTVKHGTDAINLAAELRSIGCVVRIGDT